MNEKHLRYLEDLIEWLQCARAKGQYIPPEQFPVIIDNLGEIVKESRSTSLEELESWYERVGKKG